MASSLHINVNEYHTLCSMTFKVRFLNVMHRFGFNNKKVYFDTVVENFVEKKGQY